MSITEIISNFCMQAQLFQLSAGNNVQVETCHSSIHGSRDNPTTYGLFMVSEDLYPGGV